MDQSTDSRGRRRDSGVMVMIGRMFLVLSFLALLGAWLSQIQGGPVLGLSQEHLFNDAIVLALLGIAAMVDAYWHGQE